MFAQARVEQAQEEWMQMQQSMQQQQQMNTQQMPQQPDNKPNLQDNDNLENVPKYSGNMSTPQTQAHRPSSITTSVIQEPRSGNKQDQLNKNTGKRYIKIFK